MTAHVEHDEAAHAAHTLVVGYHRDIDAGHARTAIDAFADDASFEAHGRVHHGRAEILEFLAEREANTGRHTVHVLANDVATWSGDVDDGVLELSAFVLLHVRTPDGRYVLERVLDTVHQVRRIDGRWRITRRTSAPLHPAVT